MSAAAPRAVLSLRPEPACAGWACATAGVGPQRWLDHLVRYLPRARAGEDPEGVHQVRVACARLLVWLEMAGDQRLGRDLRWLRDHAARVRDLDVVRAEERMASIPDDVAGERAAARQELRRALDDPRVDRLIDRLAAAPPVPYPDACAAVSALARTALRRGRGQAVRRGRVKALHRLRRAVRRLRFAIEWTGAESPALADLQGALGAVCDHAVALRRLRKASPAVGGRRRRHEALERALRHSRRHALRVWERTRPVLKALRRREPR